MASRACPVVRRHVLPRAGGFLLLRHRIIAVVRAPQPRRLPPQQEGRRQDRGGLTRPAPAIGTIVVPGLVRRRAEGELYTRVPHGPHTGADVRGGPQGGGRAGVRGGRGGKGGGWGKGVAERVELGGGRVSN